MDSSNGVCTHIGDECNMDDEEDAEYLPARGAKGDPSVKFLVNGGKLAMDCKMHTARHLF